MTHQALRPRTAYDQLGYSFLHLIGTVLGLAVVFLVPPVLTVSDAIPAALAWLLMAVAEAPTLWLYGLPVWSGLFLPLAALLYAGMTIDSARRYWQGRGGEWKGRTHRTAADQG